jgi:hypothetical protein
MVEIMNSNVPLATLTCPNPDCQHQKRVMMCITFRQLFYTYEDVP